MKRTWTLQRAQKAAFAGFQGRREREQALGHQEPTSAMSGFCFCFGVLEFGLICAGDERITWCPRKGEALGIVGRSYVWNIWSAHGECDTAALWFPPTNIVASSNYRLELFWEAQMSANQRIILCTSSSFRCCFKGLLFLRHKPLGFSVQQGPALDPKVRKEAVVWVPPPPPFLLVDPRFLLTTLPPPLRIFWVTLGVVFPFFPFDPWPALGLEPPGCASPLRTAACPLPDSAGVLWRRNGPSGVFHLLKGIFRICHCWFLAVGFCFWGHVLLS